MHAKRRTPAPRLASRFYLASPLLLMVSATLVAPARANLTRHSPPLLPDGVNPALRFSAIDSSRSGRLASGQLLLPPSVLEQSDSGLMRQLLLSHGVELDLSQYAEQQFVDEALLREIFSNNPLHKPVDFELVLADASGVLDPGPSDCAPTLTDEELEVGVSSHWRVTWISSCEAISADKAPLAGPDIDLGEQEISRIASEEPNEGNSTGGLQVSDEVPPGFEALAGPQNHYVDIVFNGHTVGTSTITSRPGEILFDHPAEVAQMLPNILDREELEAHLSTALPANVDKLCYGQDEPPGCGRIDAAPVAVIYNENDLVVQLFLTSELQQVQSVQTDRYLDSPARKNTSILSLYAVASDLEDGTDSSDFSLRGVLGYGRGSIQGEFDYNSPSGRRRLRSLNLTHYYPDHELLLGTYSHHTRGALADFDLLAISFSTSLKTRVDLEHAFASELVVYLPRRSVVRLVIDDRVYAGDSYPAGNQALDTTALPDGSYEVEIRILDPVSGERTERRMFTKSAQIPPRGETQYRLSAGSPLLFTDNRAFPELVDTAVVGASMARRLSDQSAYWLGLLQFGSRTFLQSEYLYLGDRVSLQFASSFGEDDTLASASRLSYSRNSVTANLGYDFFTSDFTPAADSALQSLYPADFRQVNFSLNKSLASGNIGMRSSYRREQNDPGTSSLTQYALFYRRPVFRKKYFHGLLETNLQQDDLGRRINLQFRAFFSERAVQGSLLTEASFDENHNRAYLGGLGLNWRHDNESLFDLDLGAYVSSSRNDSMYGASAAVRHPWFQSGISSDWNSIDGHQYRRSSIASLSAHLGADGRGLALGGADFAQAGVIVSIKGEPRGEKFDIIVNGIKASTGQIGQPQFIGLQPFEHYRIKLVPQSVLSNGIGTDIHEFTLYPGSVQRIETVAKKQILLIATLVNKFGELVENAIVERTPNPLLVEDGGFFQAEVSPGERIVVRPANAPPCQFVVPEAEGEDVLVLDAPLLCTDAADTRAALH